MFVKLFVVSAALTSYITLGITLETTKLFVVSAALTSYVTLGITLSPVGTGAGAVSLFSNHPQVEELLDSNSTALYNSDSLWIVLFYSHWCGHCIRFAPKWIKFAEDIQEWNPRIKVASFNCAYQSCDVYQVTGTPSIRLFFPHTTASKVDSSFYGLSLPITGHESVPFFKSVVLFNIQKAYQSGRGGTQQHFVPLLRPPYPTEDDLLSLFADVPPAVEYAALIFEHEIIDSVGKEVILDLSNYDLPVYRVDAGNFALLSAWNITIIPHMVVVARTGSVLSRVPGVGIPQQDRTTWTNILRSFAGGFKGFVSSPVLEATVSSLISTTTPRPPPPRDVVYVSDLEKAIEYSIVTEIAMQPILSKNRLNVLYIYLEVLVQHLPLRQPIKDFLISLREWPIRMNLRMVTSQEYQDKVEELINFYKPFEGTPGQYKGCKGSQPHYRGYPCTMWTLFHSLTVSAGKENAGHYRGLTTVANAVISYIRMFFSCRGCADNFNQHVTHLGFLPTSHDQTILWLWAAHNLANDALRGDSTQDPSHPKIQWPSPHNCPNCRQWNPNHIIGLVHNRGTWDQFAVLSYINNVYSRDKMVPNVPADSGNVEEDFASARGLLAEMANSTNPQTRQQFAELLNDFCP